MPETKPLDDLDFNPGNISADGAKKSKKPMPASRKIKLLLALVIAEGVIVGMLVAFWPRTLGPTTRSSTYSIQDHDGGDIAPELPDTHFDDLVHIGRDPVFPRTYSTCHWYNIAEIPAQLAEYGATLTSVELFVEASAWYNYTWCNISRLVGAWDPATVTWNTHPPVAELIGFAPVKNQSAGGEQETIFNVTTLVQGLLQGGGNNLSLLVTSFDLMNYCSVWISLRYTYSYSISGQSMSLATLLAGIAWTALQVTRKKGHGVG